MAQNKEICRLVFRHDEKTDILTVICSRCLEEKVHYGLKEKFTVPFLQGTIQHHDTWNDEGDLFKDCSILEMKISKEEVQPIFDKMNQIFIQQTQAAIGHTNN